MGRDEWSSQYHITMQQFNLAVLHSLHPTLLDTGPYSLFLYLSRHEAKCLMTIVQSLLLSRIYIQVKNFTFTLCPDCMF